MIIISFLFVAVMVPAVLPGPPEPHRTSNDPSLKRVLPSNSSPKLIMTKNAILRFGPNSKDWSNLIAALNSTSDDQRDPRRVMEPQGAGLRRGRYFRVRRS
ncbi:uncharacterized protein LOC125034489 [Penaeus chinensis]|uniref:uncharacterized protein LOC125034489 n=1 Tax=Penaeus chinensis TaxID=139456 RepID=UPI001FB681F7|nr:uncharacterized protein LOC125034489 [Penaeus chinensis]